MVKAKKLSKNNLYGCLIVLILLAGLLGGCNPSEPEISQDGIVTITATQSSQQGTADVFDEALDPDTQKALSLYPLRAGSLWVYEYLGFDQNQEVVWRVIETVVDVFVHQGYYVAKIERSAELLDGDPPPDFHYSPKTDPFYMLIDAGNVYRLDSLDDVEMEDAWLEIILPLPEPGQGWYPDPDRRSELSPDQVGYRTVSVSYKEGSLTKEFFVCYNISTETIAGSERQTFCEGVGYFYAELINFDENTGYRIELEGFSLQ